MTILLFVLLLTIPVVMLAKRSPMIVLIVAVWAFALSLSPWGPEVHAAGLLAGNALLRLFGGA